MSCRCDNAAADKIEETFQSTERNIDVNFGRFTIPSESNFAEKTAELPRLWGADAVRNSDGTQLDDEVVALGMKVYTAYFPTRAHNEWITLHMDETRRCTCCRSVRWRRATRWTCL